MKTPTESSIFSPLSAQSQLFKFSALRALNLRYASPSCIWSPHSDLLPEVTLLLEVGKHDHFSLFSTLQGCVASFQIRFHNCFEETHDFAFGN